MKTKTKHSIKVICTVVSETTFTLDALDEANAEFIATAMLGRETATGVITKVLVWDMTDDEIITTKEKK